MMQENWLCRYQPQGLVSKQSHGDVWLVCLLVAIMQFGGGTGDIGPANRVEYVLFFFCLMLGTVLWAM